MKSSTGAQLCPASSVRQTPPATLPAHMTSVLAGCTRIDRVRPPMLPGPSDTQPPGPGGRGGGGGRGGPPGGGAGELGERGGQAGGGDRGAVGGGLAEAERLTG